MSAAIKQLTAKPSAAGLQSMVAFTAAGRFPGSVSDPVSSQKPAKASNDAYGDQLDRLRYKKDSSDLLDYFPLCTVGSLTGGPWTGWPVCSYASDYT